MILNVSVFITPGDLHFQRNGLAPPAAGCRSVSTRSCSFNALKINERVTLQMSSMSWGHGSRYKEHTVCAACVLARTVSSKMFTFFHCCWALTPWLATCLISIGCWSVSCGDALLSTLSLSPEVQRSWYAQRRGRCPNHNSAEDKEFQCANGCY